MTQRGKTILHTVRNGRAVEVAFAETAGATLRGRTYWTRHAPSTEWRTRRVKSEYETVGAFVGFLTARGWIPGNAPKSARRAPKDFACQECGTRLTLAAAERAVSEGCPKCGGSDVDLAVGR